MFGNLTCADPEGKVPLFTAPTRGAETRVLTVAGGATLKGLTVTYTDAAGKTSVFSNCADAKTQPDTDGVPDLVEANAPIPFDTTASLAAFMSDT